MTFSKEIIDILNYLCNKFGIAIDWTSDNVMPYLKNLCERYISYEIFSSIVWMAIFPIIAIIVAIPLSILHKKAKEVKWSDCYASTILAIILWVLFITMIVVSICVISTSVFDIIECYTLPEKVIFEYLQSLMNSVK